MRRNLETEMARKKKKKRKGRVQSKRPMPPAPWLDEDGIHITHPALVPSQEDLEEMTRTYQNQIRNSPIWDKMIEELGKEKAEEILQQCRAELW